MELAKRDVVQFLLGSFVGLTVTCLLAERNNILQYVNRLLKWIRRKGATRVSNVKGLICGNVKRNFDKRGRESRNKGNANINELGDNEEINDRTNNSDFDSNVPEQCPGVESENAGRAKACEGCPNRNICNSGELKKEKVQIVTDIEENLKNVKYKILILSGKGGVGKSTVATQIAFALSYLNYEIGLLDIDICGPSIPILTNTINSDVNHSMSGWVPIYKNNLSIMSIGYLLPDFDDAVIWRGPKKNGLIKQFLSEVYWKNLDFLIIDTPPGTSDEHLTICSYLNNNLNGSLIITTPHILSICDVKKEIEFCKKTKIPILGVVENMYQSVFVNSEYTVEKMCQEMEVPYAGRITFHEDLIAACKQGTGCCDMDATTNTSKEVFSVCKFLVDQLIKREEEGEREEKPQKNNLNNSTSENEGMYSREDLLNTLANKIDQYI